jgi:ribosome-associated protein
MPGSGPLRVNREVVIPESELHFEFARSGGPGGQRVNKVETKVVLRFSIPASRALEERHKERLQAALASRLTTAGEVLVQAERHRDRIRNLEDARARLAGLLAQALLVPKARRPSRPSRGSVARRLESKRKRSATKRERRGADE